MKRKKWFPFVSWTLVIAILYMASYFSGSFYMGPAKAQLPHLIQRYADPSPPFPYKYNTVAASQTAQVLTGGGGGALGDYLVGCTVIPATTSPGAVTVLDNSTSIVLFAGGASSVTNLVPFYIRVDAASAIGKWKVTTGTNVSVVCNGSFT